MLANTRAPKRKLGGAFIAGYWQAKNLVMQRMLSSSSLNLAQSYL